MARILAVGIATLDVINEVDVHPAEDAEVRALAQSVCRGGNATNTLVVLSQLGHQCAWAGVLVDEPGVEVITADLARYCVDSRYCRYVPQGHLPTSYITLSRSTGSRTIVHYRDLPEYDYASFAEIPLDGFDWIHFEGRNVAETLPMVKQARSCPGDTRISLEYEKPREGIEQLFPYADLILCSQGMCSEFGAEPEHLLKHIQGIAPHAVVVGALGADGALALDKRGAVVRSVAVAPARIIDTIGAGDTFNAAMIDQLLNATPVQQALDSACYLAGAKCGQKGFDGLDSYGENV